MTIFFGLLFLLVAFNGLLLVFSSSGSTKAIRRSIKKSSEITVANIFSRQEEDKEYKKAV